MSFRDQAVPQDWDRIAAWLAGKGHSLELTQPPVQFAGGLANLNYRVMLDGAPAVFRRPPAGALAHGASDMAREARVLAALNPVFPLAPRLLACCDDRAVIGVDFLLLEFRPGIAIGGALPPGMGANDGGWLLEALAQALSGLHALVPEPRGLGHLGRPSGFAARQLSGWTRRAQDAFGSEVPPALAPLVDRLAASVPADSPVRLLHMDAKLDNLLVDPATRRATALIDWDMGTLGPPAFDLAVLLSYWIAPDDPPDTHALGAVPSLVPGFPDRRDVIAAYAAASGSVPPDLGWYLALARLRLATAWMQLYRLWQQGRLEGARYSGFARLAGAILAQALARFGEAQ